MTRPHRSEPDWHYTRDACATQSHSRSRICCRKLPKPAGKPPALPGKKIRVHPRNPRLIKSERQKSGGLLVRNLIAGRTMGAAIAIDRDQFRRPTMGTKTEAQLMGQSRLRDPQVVFRFVEKGFEMNGGVSVSGKIFPCDPKFV